MKLKRIKFNSKVVENTTMLYLYTFAKIIFPLITLPYLTRVLSLNTYGMVSFVKAYMIYIQLFVDFGFILSSVKEIVRANKNNELIGLIVGQTIVAKIILSCISIVVTFFLIFMIDTLQDNILFTFLSLLVIVVSSFLLDFLFRGIEEMKIFTFSFILMKAISTLLIILLVKKDSHVLLIPVFDLSSSLVAILYTWTKIKKLNIIVRFESLKKSIFMIKESLTYFLSNIATTAFGAFNTLLIGIVMSNDQVAVWSLALYVISAINALYSPIVNGIYPNMIRTKSIKFIKKILFIFMPIVIIGSTFLFFLSDFVIFVMAGEQYAQASLILKLLIPVLVFSFPSMILGWPTLGAIGKEKEVMFTTVITAIVQVSGLLLIVYIGEISLIQVAFFRSITELLMLLLRWGYVHRYNIHFD